MKDGLIERVEGGVEDDIDHTVSRLDDYDVTGLFTHEFFINK